MTTFLRERFSTAILDHLSKVTAFDTLKPVPESISGIPFLYKSRSKVPHIVIIGFAVLFFSFSLGTLLNNGLLPVAGLIIFVLTNSFGVLITHLIENELDWAVKDTSVRTENTVRDWVKERYGLDIPTKRAWKVAKFVLKARNYVPDSREVFAFQSGSNWYLADCSNKEIVIRSLDDEQVSKFRKGKHVKKAAKLPEATVIAGTFNIEDIDYLDLL